jgi:predicted DNA-binding transcriptional regulator AlpA
MSLRVIDGDQQPERYVDRREMAGILGISLSSLDKLVADERIPSCTWGLRSRRFQPSMVIAALKRSERKAA